MDGRLIVISGPSGVGKTTVCDVLLRDPRFVRVVTATSRPPRPGEVDGVHYHFLPAARFEEAIGGGDFLEYARVHGHLYGTPRRQVEEGLRRGKWVLLIIDVQGARQVLESVRSGAPLPLLRVFIEPPSMEELELRLRGRATDAPEAVQRRLETARREMEERGRYDLAVVNDQVEAAARRIIEALEGTGGRRSRERS